MKNKLKIAVVFVSVLFSAFVLLISKNVYELKVEDNIHHKFKQVAWSLEKFCEVHKSAPQKLEDLIPDYLSSMPSSEYVEKIEYKLRNSGTDWELRIYYRFLRIHRFITVRSDNRYDDMNKDDLKKIYHGDWHVWEN